jgi:carbonic anhydrase
MKRVILLILVGALGLFLSTCTNNKKTATEEQEQVKESEYLVPGLEHGLMQSPINILSSETNQGRYNVTLNFKGEINMIENLGHTVQLDFSPGNTITLAGETYEFRQLHFHTPSEHLIDGVTYPMEMHVVNTLTGQKKDETPKYLVLAYLFKMGKQEPFIELFLDLIPEEENQTRDVNLNLLTSGITNEEQLKQEFRSFYHYKGSLTTPPYTESVDWYVLSNIYEASPEQIQRINELEGDNARHIQAVYGREIDEN